MIVLKIEVFAMKIVVAKGFILAIIDVDEDDINIEIAWIEQNAVVT